MCSRWPCDTMSLISSELAGMEADDVGRVAPGECSMPVPALACAVGPACWGAKPREEAQGPPFHPGEQPGEGKAGRANVSKPLWMSRNEQLREMGCGPG
jgi:hypothetical protein